MHLILSSKYKKSGTVFLYLDSFYSLNVTHNIVIYYYICQSSEICRSYIPTFAMEIAHNTTLNTHPFIVIYINAKLNIYLRGFVSLSSRSINIL